MKLYVICSGSTILRYGHASQRQLDGMAGALKAGESLHEVQEDFAGMLSDETHEWDDQAQAVVPISE